MQDILQDIVSHTHSLGFITTLKVTAETETQMVPMKKFNFSVLKNIM